MEEFSGGIEMDENSPESCGGPCTDNREVCGLLHALLIFCIADEILAGLLRLNFITMSIFSIVDIIFALDSKRQILHL